MLEYPEIKTIARQMETVLPGKQIELVSFPGMVRKFVFSDQDQPEFRKRLTGKTIDHIESTGNHLFIFTKEGPVLKIGDTGGKLLFTEANQPLPKKFDLRVTFTDGTTMTHSVQMWGFISAFEKEEDARILQQKILEEARDPFSNEVTRKNFLAWLRDWEEAPKVNAKKFIVSRKYITGLGNGYTQDILWYAKLHPRRKMATLIEDEAKRLLDAFQYVVMKATKENGRTTERDFFNEPGQYEVKMGRNTVGTPCPDCDTEIIKFSFEGGACYICPTCQPDPRLE